jgi:hypothetical protein
MYSIALQKILSENLEGSRLLSACAAKRDPGWLVLPQGCKPGDNCFEPLRFFALIKRGPYFSVNDG